MHAITYGDELGHLDTVASGAGTTALSWYPGSAILKQAVTTTSGNVVRRETRVVDVAGRITGLHTSTGPENSINTVAASGYTLDALGRRETARREDGSTWTYGYNARSEVTSGRKKLAGMTTAVAAGLSFDYLYDDIGNRQWAKSGGDEVGASQRHVAVTRCFNPRRLLGPAKAAHRRGGTAACPSARAAPATRIRSAMRHD